MRIIGFDNGKGNGVACEYSRIVLFQQTSQSGFQAESLLWVTMEHNVHTMHAIYFYVYLFLNSTVAAYCIIYIIMLCI